MLLYIVETWTEATILQRSTKETFESLTSNSRIYKKLIGNYKLWISASCVINLLLLTTLILILCLS